MGDPSGDSRKCDGQINDLVAAYLEWVAGKRGQIRLHARSDFSEIVLVAHGNRGAAGVSLQGFACSEPLVGFEDVSVRFPGRPPQSRPSHPDAGIAVGNGPIRSERKSSPSAQNIRGTESAPRPLLPEAPRPFVASVSCSPLHVKWLHRGYDALLDEAIELAIGERLQMFYPVTDPPQRRSYVISIQRLTDRPVSDRMSDALKASPRETGHQL
jgi:hypothetical protein